MTTLPVPLTRAKVPALHPAGADRRRRGAGRRPLCRVPHRPDPQPEYPGRLCSRRSLSRLMRGGGPEPSGDPAGAWRGLGRAAQPRV